ncbi:unnamed protein product [Victoria cruziana]
MMKHPNYGFDVTDRGCCGTGFLCNPFTSVCPNASSYMFWDAIHPSQRAYSLISNVIVQDQNEFHTICKRFLSR